MELYRNIVYFLEIIFTGIVYTIYQYTSIIIDVLLIDFDLSFNLASGMKDLIRYESSQFMNCDGIRITLTIFSPMGANNTLTTNFIPKPVTSPLIRLVSH